MELALYVAAAATAVLVFVQPYLGLLVLSFMPPFEDSFLAVGASGASVTRYLGFFVVAAWAFNKVRVRRMPYYDSSMRWGILFLCWAGLSVSWSVYWRDSVDHLPRLVQFAGLALMTADLASSPRRVAGVLGAFLVGCFGVCLMGILVPSLRGVGSQMTLAGTGAKEYSMYAGGVVLAGLILLASRGVPARLSRTGVLAGAVSAFVVASAGERGTILALVLALVVLGLIEGGRMRKVGWFVTAVILVGVTTNLLSLKGMLAPEVASRFSVEDVVATGGTGRLAIWSKGLALFRQSPVIGHGLKTFAPLFTSGRAFPLIRGPVGGRSPHNDLLGIAVDLGMIGVLLYLAFVGWASVRPLRVRTSVGGSQLRVLPLLVSGLLIYWVCGGLTSEVFYLKTFWLLLGLSYAVSRAPTPQDESGLATEASWIPDPP